MLLTNSKRSTKNYLNDIRPSELRVLRLIFRGLSNKTIARQLVVSESTVKAHVSSMLRLFEVKNRLQLVLLLQAQSHAEINALLDSTSE